MARTGLVSGALVHARVTRADKYVDAELSCSSPGGNSKQWMTGESVFGVLPWFCVFDACAYEPPVACAFGACALAR
jgi:hypothetical protein